MGRNTTGCTYTSDALRLELSQLIKGGLIQQGKKIEGTISWTNGSKVSIKACYTASESYIELNYVLYNRETNTSNKQSYRVYLTAVKSNLGQGEVLYFICPVSRKRCRILYKSHSSIQFQHRATHQQSVYYPSQCHSKYNYWNERYWQTQKELEQLEESSYRRTYKGKPTRKYLAIQKKRALLEQYEEKSENIFNWRVYNWGVNFFNNDRKYQKSILNSEECLYTKYHLEGKRAAI